MITTTEKLRSLILNAAEIKNLTDWPERMIEDYLNLFDNAIKIATDLDELAGRKLEDIETDFLDGSIPFVDSGFLIEDNPDFTWDNINNILRAVNVLAESLEAITIRVTGLDADAAVATDSNKDLVSIPYLNEETEFFIHAVC